MTPFELYDLVVKSQRWSRDMVEAYDNFYFMVTHNQMEEFDARYTSVRDALGVPHGLNSNIVNWTFKRSHGVRFTEEELKDVWWTFKKHQRNLQQYNQTKKRALNQQDIYSLAARREAQSRYEKAKARGTSSKAIWSKLFCLGLPDDWCYEEVEDFFHLLNG